MNKTLWLFYLSQSRTFDWKALGECLQRKGKTWENFNFINVMEESIGFLQVTFVARVHPFFLAEVQPTVASCIPRIGSRCIAYVRFTVLTLCSYNLSLLYIDFVVVLDSIYLIYFVSFAFIPSIESIYLEDGTNNDKAMHL